MLVDEIHVCSERDLLILVVNPHGNGRGWRRRDVIVLGLRFSSDGRKGGQREGKRGFAGDYVGRREGIVGGSLSRSASGDRLRLNLAVFGSILTVRLFAFLGVMGGRVERGVVEGLLLLLLEAVAVEASINTVDN
jgi:hypothetical protein